ncbi:kinase-like protein, partial [Auricularia subglabra TFB-10046 SS5]
KNIVNLYDCFFSPSTYELFMVFEFMEGNLHQLLRRRQTAGHALAEGLVASIFEQMVQGLHHVHMFGYMHRDLKPENVLPDSSDLTVTIKISDFGLAREFTSHRPCTGYVATRWYRAPEVLLRDSSYSQPVDIWALGLILIELVALEPLFPGYGELDQLNRINRVLGYPSSQFDSRGRLVGGGPWPAGIRMAESLGFVFRKV